MSELLERIECYYDSVPRAAAEPQECGPFTIFVPRVGTATRYYARPSLGQTVTFTADDVRRVLARQRELGLPEAVEWVDETTPTLKAAAATAVGAAATVICPLLVQESSGEPAVDDRLAVLTSGDDLETVRGAVRSAFADQDEVMPASVGIQRELLDAGLLRIVGAYDDAGSAVGGGTSAPRGDVAELMGIGVLPRARRRGLGAAIAARLAADARAAGVSTAFCSAQDEDVASVYGRVGFRRLATACILEL